MFYQFDWVTMCCIIISDSQNVSNVSVSKTIYLLCYACQNLTHSGSSNKIIGISRLSSWCMQCTFADGCLLTGRPSDDRPTCPPPITAERARQNVPSASSYMPLKHSRTCRSSGSNEQETGSTSMQSIGQASGQRVLNDEARTENAPRKKVRLVFFCTCITWSDLHCESKKLCHFYFYCNFGKYWPILIILSGS